MASNVKLVGSVGIKVRPVTDGFRRDAEHQVKEKLSNADAKFPVEPELTEESKRRVKREMKQTTKEMQAESGKVEIEVEADHLSIRRARAEVKKLEDELKKPLVKKIKVDNDASGLRKAAQQIDDFAKKHDKVSIKYRNDEQGLKSAIEQTKRYLRELLPEYEIKTKFDKDSLEKQLKTFEDRLARVKANTVVNFKYDNNRAGLEKAIAEIDNRLRQMDALELKVKDNPKGWEKARKQMQKELDRTPLEIPMHMDEKGWEKLIADLEARKRDLEHAAQFAVTPDELKSAEGMQRAIERARAQAALADIHIDINYRNDLLGLDQAIATLQQKLRDKKTIHFVGELSEKEIRAKIAELQAERHSLGLQFEVDDSLAGIEAARERIKQELDKRKPKLRFDVSLNTSELEAELLKIDLEILKRRTLRVGLTGEKTVAARLALLARTRVATIVVKARDLTAFTFAKLTGLRAAARWTQEFGKALGSLDRNLPIVAAVTMGISQLGASLLSLTSNALVLGQGLAQIGQLGLLGPAVLGGLAASMIVWIAVFKDFGAAVNGDTKAMKALTASGQEAAKKIRPLFQDLREGMTKNFWDGASNGMLRFVNTALPQFSKGFKNLATAFGQGFGGVLDSFTQFAKNGGVTTQFNFLTTGIKLANQGAKDFWNAINTLGAVGSRIFPRMGQAFTNISAKFDDWVQRITADGSLTRWVDRGIENLKGLGRGLVNLMGVWSNFAAAAEAAGGATIRSLADALGKFKEVTAGFRFQNNMQAIFEGAHTAMANLGSALGSLAPKMDQFSQTIKNLLTGASTALGSAIKWVGDILGSPAIDAGLRAFTSGLDSMFRSLRPSASAISEIIKTLGEVLGTVATDAGPLFAELFQQLSTVFRAAFDELRPFIPELTDLGRYVISQLGPALTNLAQSVIPMLGKAFEVVTPIVSKLADGIKGLTDLVKQSNDLNVKSNGKWDLADLFGTGTGTGVMDGLFGDQTAQWDKAKKQVQGQMDGLASWWDDFTRTKFTFDKGFYVTPKAESDAEKQIKAAAEKQQRAFQQAAEDASVGTSGLNAGVQAWADSANHAASKLLEAERAAKILGDTSIDAKDKVDAFNASLKILGGDKLSKRDALAKQISDMARFKAEAASLAPELAKVKDSLVGKDGLLNIDSGNVAVLGLRDTMRSAADDVKATAQATYEASQKNGMTVKDSVKAALDAVKAGHTNLEDIAKAAGVDVKTLDAEWSTFFGKDWVLAATFTGQTDKFDLAAQEAKDRGLEFDGEEFWGYLMADGNPANETTEQIKAHMVEWANKQYQAKLDALPDPAKSVLEALLDSVDKRWRHGDFEATMKAAQSIPGLAEVIAKLMAGKGPYDASFIAQLDPASAAAVTGALRAIAAEQHVATISVQYSDPGPMPGTKGGGMRYVNADGGIYARNAKVFANGGFSFENHIAQIARPGVVPRVWAEAETGGEAYIPYALHKRQRSTEILSRVASDFGYQLVRRYADGGTSSSSTSYSAPVTIGQLITTDPDQAVKALQTKRRDAMAVHQIKAF